MAVYKDEKRKTWYFQCRDTKKKQVTRRGFKTKRDAQNAEADFLRQKTTQASTLSFERLEAMHRQEYIKEKRTATIQQYDSIVKLHLLPFFQGTIPSLLHQRDIQVWKDTIEQKNLSKSFLSKTFQTLRSIFQYGVKFYDFPHNVV